MGGKELNENKLLLESVSEKAMIIGEVPEDVISRSKILDIRPPVIKHSRPESAKETLKALMNR